MITLSEFLESIPNYLLGMFKINYNKWKTGSTFFNEINNEHQISDLNRILNNTLKQIK
jgi:hypothetical protein